MNAESPTSFEGEVRPSLIKLFQKTDQQIHKDIAAAADLISKDSSKKLYYSVPLISLTRKFTNFHKVKLTEKEVISISKDKNSISKPSTSRLYYLAKEICASIKKELQKPKKEFENMDFNSWSVQIIISFSSY